MGKKKKLEGAFETTDLYYSLKILYVDDTGKETAIWSHSSTENMFEEDKKHIEFFRGKNFLLEKRIGSDTEKYEFV